MSRESSLERLAGAARNTRWRLRLDEVFARSMLLLPLPLVYFLGVLTWIKVFRPSLEFQEVALYVGLLPTAIWLVGTALRWMTRRPALVGAIALDRHHGLRDRISSALSFRELPVEERTPLMQLAIEDAVSVARDITPSKAAPFHVPRELPLVLLLAGAIGGIALLEVRTYREVVEVEDKFSPLVMNPDDVELFRRMADDLERENKDPETLAAIRKFNQLIEDIANRRLEREEVFKRLADLDKQLAKGLEEDKEALDDGLKAIAKELDRSKLAKPIARAFRKKRLKDAEKAMKKLAERLKNKKKPPSKAELDKLRKALEKASRANAERAKRLDAKRAEVEKQRKSLLKKKKKKDGKLSKKDRSLLKKKKRQLERLDRERKKVKSAQRQLSRLDRELAKAAADLAKEMGLSGKDLDAAAENINRLAKQEMTDNEKKELRKRLKEMRELLRQQGKGGKKREELLRRFGKKARGGKSGQGGKPGRGGKPGQGRPGKGGKGGKGQGGVRMGKGSGGKSVPIPGSGSGQGQGQGSGQGQGQGDKPGQGAGKGGESWGTGHDPNLKGDKSEIAGRTKDVSAAGVDSGQGSASSQVIQGAAQRGFTARGYKKVYTDYQTVAEDVMDKDDIPPGYRFYVRRYFQLIRPRD